MRIWKQLLISVAVVLIGIALWLKFVPGAASFLVSVGVPESMVFLLAPEDETVGQSGDAQDMPGVGRGRGGFGGATTVVTAKVEDGVANDRLQAIGNGDAIHSVTVTSDEAGKVAEILVSAGDAVKAGDILAKLDSREQVIALRQAKLDLKTSEEKLERYENLKGNLSQVDLAEVRAATETARLAVESAELALDQRNIVAPISGITGIVDVELGQVLTTTTTIVTIDDRSSLLVEFWAPERFSGTILDGMPISATAIARPGTEYEGEVAAVDSRVDEESRTFRVQVRIDNKTDELRAGMSFKVTLKLEGQDYPAVDPLAIQWDSDGAYVWKVVDGKTERAAIRIIQRNPENVLVEGEVKSGDALVVEGIQRVRAGSEVQVQGQGAPSKSEKAPDENGASS